MTRKDYEDGSFPLTRYSPVIMIFGPSTTFEPSEEWSGAKYAARYQERLRVVRLANDVAGLSRTKRQ